MVLTGVLSLKVGRIEWAFCMKWPGAVGIETFSRSWLLLDEPLTYPKPCFCREVEWFRPACWCTPEVRVDEEFPEAEEPASFAAASLAYIKFVLA